LGAYSGCRGLTGALMVVLSGSMLRQKEHARPLRPRPALLPGAQIASADIGPRPKPASCANCWC